MRIIFVAVAGFFLGVGSTPILSQQVGNDDSAAQSIRIVTGVFGSLGKAAKLDIANTLQQLCGGDAQSCQVFCSETSFGRYTLGRHPICRVTYRCGTALVRSVEAAREEPIIMRCPIEAQALIPPAYRR
jgi:hypothetical protein